MDIKAKINSLKETFVPAFKKGAVSLKDSVPLKKTADFFAKKKKVISPFLKKASKKLKNIKLPEKLSFSKEKYHKYRKLTVDVLTLFWRREPQIAAFVFVCIFSAFSILFLDKFFALIFLKSKIFTVFRFISLLNPSAWWFLILGGLWLFYTIYAGYSETPEVFAVYTKKANHLVFVLLTLGISSAVTILINILVGRYDTSALSEGLYGFSLLSAGATFPSWGAQSIWAVCLSFGHLFPKYRKNLIYTAEAVSVCLILSGTYFISDVIIGTYIGIMAYQIADWFFSDNRENQKLISFDEENKANEDK